MSGGGGTTTNVTNTGLGDSQFDTLRSGQQSISSQVNTGFDNTNAIANQINASVAGVGRDVNQGFATTNQNIGAVNQNVVGGFDAANRNMAQGFDTTNRNLSQGFGTTNQNLAQGFGTTNQNLAQGFDLTNRNLTQGLAATNQNMNQGFDATNRNLTQGFADTRQDVNTGFANLGNRVDQQFDAQGRAIDTGFRGAADQLNTVQSNVLGGQANLRTLMEQYGGNLDRYYADLARGQADAQQRLGGLQSGLDEFRGDFRTADTVARQQSARLADSVAGGFNAVRDDLGRSMDTLGGQTQQVAAQVSGLGSQMDQMSSQTEINFGRLARDMAAGFDDGSQQTQAARNDFVSRLNTIRNLVSDPNIPVDQQTRQQYADLAQSFDEQGRLIARSVDGMGNQVSRALDSQGNLLLAAFDQGGNRISQQALNVDSMMQMLSQIGYQPAATSTQGLAAPFISTQ